MHRTHPIDSRALEGVVANEARIEALSKRIDEMEQRLEASDAVAVNVALHDRMDKVSQSCRDKGLALERKTEESLRRLDSRIETWANSFEPRVAAVERDIPALQSLVMRQLQGLESEMELLHRRRKEAQQEALAALY